MYSVRRFNSKKIIPIAASDFCNRYYLTSLNTSGGLTSFFNREPYRCPSVITSNNSFPNYSNFINVFSFLDCIIAPCLLYCKSFLKIYIIQGISWKTQPSCTASYIHRLSIILKESVIITVNFPRIYRKLVPFSDKYIFCTAFTQSFPDI